MEPPAAGLAAAFATFAEDFVRASERVDEAILALVDAMEELDWPGGQPLTTSEMRLKLGAGTDGAVEFTSEGGIRQRPSAN
jgi:hypothetical protein